MVLLIIIASVILAVLLLVFEQKPKNPREKTIIKLILSAFLMLSGITLLTQDFTPANLQIAAATFVICIMVFRTLMASFWGKVLYQTLLILLLFWCGYLYSTNQLPYEDVPFSLLSQSQPKPLIASEVNQQNLLGLPLETQAGDPNLALPSTVILSVPTKPNTDALGWDALWSLMEKDARIRQKLQALREKQQQDLTAFSNQLNATSVASTSMRRHALGSNNLQDLLKENAISMARYKTMMETWSLLDSDEQAFSKRQEEERYHVLLELIEDGEIDESHKIELIDFMVRNFAGDIRLFKPLLNVYDGLDHEYPRLKRLNQEYLALYLAKREAVLNGFRAMGKSAVQPLKDYRNKVLPTLSYSQARLDDFMTTEFGVPVRSLYQQAPVMAVADFLNRKKYQGLSLLSGPSFSEDYARKTLRQLIAENAAPQKGELLLGLSESKHQTIVKALSGSYNQQIDRLLIDPDPAIRANMAWYLAEIKNPYQIPLVLELMRDQNPEVRRIAAIAAGNFSIRDTQGSSDPKFTEIVRMLQNYRSNSDAFGRAWAVTALANVGDKQKALYVIDLILSDGTASQSIVGQAAPTWSEDDKHVIADLVDTLHKTPEELLVKTQALNTLIALESPEALDVLLHYLEHIYTTRETRPSMWRFLAPHFTLPQEAENVEDVVFYLAQTQGNGHPQFLKRQLKALHDYLRQAYQHNRSGEFFQFLSFLKKFDQQDYQEYLAQTSEQIRVMRVVEYLTATFLFWLVVLPLNLLIALLVSYLVLPALNLEPVRVGHGGNSRANPAAFGNVVTSKAPIIVPIKITKTTGDEHVQKQS